MTKNQKNMLLEMMSTNHPYDMGNDYYVSIKQNWKDDYQLTIFHEERYKLFLTEDLVADMMAYARTLDIRMSIWSCSNVPVIKLS